MNQYDCRDCTELVESNQDNMSSIDISMVIDREKNSALEKYCDIRIKKVPTGEALLYAKIKKDYQIKEGNECEVCGVIFGYVLRELYGDTILDAQKSEKHFDVLPCRCTNCENAEARMKNVCSCCNAEFINDMRNFCVGGNTCKLCASDIAQSIIRNSNSTTNLMVINKFYEN